MAKGAQGRYVSVEEGTGRSRSEGSVTYSPDQAVEGCGFGRFQIVLCCLAGFCWMADAMETMLLAFVTPAVRCEWNLSDGAAAVLTSCVFVGMLVGAYVWGRVSDTYGRRRGFLFCTLFTLVAGVLSAAAPSFEFLVFFRTLVGFGVAGAHVAFTLFAEFLPASQRAISMLMLELFWAVGSMVESGLAWTVLEPLGWRALLLFSSLPLLALALLFPMVPESPRFLMIKGRRDEAERVFERLAEMNKRPLPPGRLADPPRAEPAKGFKDLLVPEFRHTSVLLWFMWFVLAFTYYGLVLFNQELFREENAGHRCGYGDDGNSNDEGVCVELTNDDYLSVFITSVAEFPGILLTALIINRIGRRRTLRDEFVLSSLFVFLIFPCTSRNFETFLFFCSRALVTGAFQAAYVYTPEVYPTNMRSTGLGVCSSMARLGGILTPFVAQVVTHTSVFFAVVFYAGFLLLAGYAAHLLRVETAGKPLDDLPITGERGEVEVETFDEEADDDTVPLGQERSRILHGRPRTDSYGSTSS